MAADVGKVDRVQCPVFGAEPSVDVIANGCASRAPVDAVHQFIDLVAKQCAKLLPVTGKERLFQRIGKAGYRPINGHFLKHARSAATASSAASASAGTAAFLAQFVDLVEAHDGALDLVRGVLCAAAGALGRVAP